MKSIKNICATVAAACLATAGYADRVQDHQDAQSRPIELGTSGGNLKDESSLYCCSGTLGAVVRDKKGKLYILSNNHVLARTNRGHRREAITQPGLVDAQCWLATNDAVAVLTKRQGIHFGGGKNVIDAAIAQILPGKVDPAGGILGMGTVGSGIVAPAVGMAVKKSGRTSGVTRGSIAAVDVTLWVTYDKVCGIGTRVAQFVHQIRIIPGAFGDFSAGGDSGSLVVEDVDSCPRAVGLLFAGGDTDTFANPITNVLSRLRVNMVGCSSTTTSAAVAFAEPAMTAAHAVSAESFSACKSAKEAAEADLLKIPGVIGLGIGISDTESGQATLEIYSSQDPAELRQRLPRNLSSVPVKIVRTGTIHAL